MIRAAKHLNLNTCVLRASSHLLVTLQAERLCSYEALHGSLIDLGPDADILFLPTVHSCFFSVE